MRLLPTTTNRNQRSAQTKLAKRKKVKTARAVLRFENEVLLAVHSSFWARPNRRWGLPGGGIEWRETPEEAVRREISEEFEVVVSHFTELGSYPYKGNHHAVFGAYVNKRLDYYDDSELLDIGWYSLAEVDELARSGKLHAGYEHQAIAAFFAEKN